MTRKERWQELKQQYPNAVVLLQNGNFYEAYEMDATKVGEILNIPTEQHEDGLYSVCHFPLVSLNENYLPRLVRAGLSVAIIEEL